MPACLHKHLCQRQFSLTYFDSYSVPGGNYSRRPRLEKHRTNTPCTSVVKKLATLPYSTSDGPTGPDLVPALHWHKQPTPIITLFHRWYHHRHTRYLKAMSTTTRAATVTNGNYHPITDQLNQRVTATSTTSDRLSPRRFFTGLSSQSPSPIFHPTVLIQGNERSPPNSPIFRVNTPNGLTGTRFEAGNNTVSSSSISSDNNATIATTRYKHSAGLVDSIISNGQLDYLDVPSHTLKVTPSLTVSTGGGSTVLAGCDIPACVMAGAYKTEFHVGSNTTDQPNVNKVFEVKFSNGKIVSPEGVQDWLQHVQPARDRHEQNLEAFSDSSSDGEVAVRTLRTLQKGEQLFVWYSDQLARETGIPVLTPDNIKGKQHYTCTKCGKSYLYPNTLKAHMRFRCALSRAEILHSLNSSVPFTIFPSSTSRHFTTTPLDKCSSTNTGISDEVGPVSSSGWSAPFERRRSPPMDGCRLDEGLFLNKNRQLSTNFPNSAFLLRGSNGASSTTTSCAPSTSTAEPGRTPEIALNLSTKNIAPDRNPSSTSDRLPPSSTAQPIQIFNHIHPPAIPFTFEHSAFQCYCPFYTKFHDPTRFCCASMPPTNPSTTPRNPHENVYFSHPCPMPFPLMQMRNLPGTNPVVPESQQPSVDENLRMRELPLKFPLPSDKAGEPLDLLPRSLYTSKSRKGHLCIYCGKLYSRKYGLKIHLRTHTGYKPLKCKVCLRPFGDPSNLNKHIRLHAEGDTPYRCEFCGKVLVRRRDLERHIKSRHPSEAEKSEAREMVDETEPMPELKVEADGDSTEEETNS